MRFREPLLAAIRGVGNGAGVSALPASEFFAIPGDGRPDTTGRLQMRKTVFSFV